MALTPKRTRFVEEYLVDLNGAQAAIRAGFSPKTAKEQSYQLLKLPEIQEAIEAGRQAQQARSEAGFDPGCVKTLHRAIGVQDCFA